MKNKALTVCQFSRHVSTSPSATVPAEASPHTWISSQPDQSWAPLPLCRYSGPLTHIPVTPHGQQTPVSPFAFQPQIEQSPLDLNVGFARSDNSCWAQHNPAWQHFSSPLVLMPFSQTPSICARAILLRLVTRS